MNKRIIVIVMLSAALVSGFIPVTKSDTFTINAPFDNVYRQFISPKSWLKWEPGLKGLGHNQVAIDSNKSGFKITEPETVINLQEMGLGNFAIIQTQGNNTSGFNCAFVPDNKTNKSRATVTRKTNLFGYLSGLIINSHRPSPIAGLKAFMEDTRQYYGFIIRRELTSKKLIAVQKRSLLSSELYRQTNGMLLRLNDFIVKNKLKITSPLQMQYVAVTKDSTQLMLGFPVDKKAAPANGVEYMTMPQGKILVGYFNDQYKNKGNLYNAVRQYMADNYMHPIIQPFERFDNNKVPLSDTSRINMQLIVPYM